MACSPLSHRQRYWQVPHATQYAHSYGSLGCDRSLVILQCAMHNQIQPTMLWPPSSTPPSLQTSSLRTSMGCTTKPSSTFGTSRGGTKASWSCTVLCTCVAHMSSLPEAPLMSYCRESDVLMDIQSADRSSRICLLQRTPSGRRFLTTSSARVHARGRTRMATYVARHTSEILSRP